MVERCFFDLCQFRLKSSGFYDIMRKDRNEGMLTVHWTGCSVNIGKNETYLNTGIPGTGLYDRKKIDYPNNSIIPEQNQEIPNSNYILETEIKSYNPELLTSDSMLALKKSILDAEKVKKEMFEEWQQANSSKNSTLFFLIILHFVIIGFFLKGLKQEYREKNFLQKI